LSTIQKNFLSLLAFLLHCACVALALLYIRRESLLAADPAWSIDTWMPKDWLPPDWAVNTWLASALLMLAMPWFPLIAVIVHLGLFYALSRYSNEYGFMVYLGIFQWISLLAATGWLARQIRTGERLQPLRDPLFGCFALFVFWVGVCFAEGLQRGPLWDVCKGHHPLVWLDSLVLMAVTIQFIQLKRDFLVLFAAFTLAALGHGSFFVSSNWRNNDAAAIYGIAIPLAVGFGRLATPWALRCVAAIATVALLRMTYQTENRAAWLAVFACIPMICMAMVPRRWMLLGIPLVLGAMLLLWMTPTGERFKEIFSEKGDNGRQRIEIWDAAIQMTKDNPWFGVGPGNFQNVIETYDSQLARMFSHNSFLNVLAETGVIGLLLYLSVFLIGAFQLGKAIHRHRREWREQATWFVAGGIVAFLVISLFLTRHLMTIAYILLGCSSVLARTPSKSIPKDDASGESPNGISRVFHSTP
jgi:hypothetical protein